MVPLMKPRSSCEEIGIHCGTEERLIVHSQPRSPDGKRSHRTAFVPDNDGETWQDGLRLDETKRPGRNKET